MNLIGIHTIMFGLTLSASLILAFGAGFIHAKLIQPQGGVFPKIIGGQPVPAGKLLYQAELLGNGIHACGASIVAEQFVVTSASCIRQTTGVLTVRAGHASSPNPEPSAQTRNVISSTVHPEFSGIQNNIGVLKLDMPFVLNEFVGPIKIPSQGCTVGTSVNELLLASGWSSSGSGAGALGLEKVTLLVISQIKCKSLKSNIRPTMICAGNATKDACNGDWGGPLVTTKTPIVLVGVISAVNGDCSNTDPAPTIFTRVQHYSDWIKSQMV